ncbi:MAG: hypothetical protein IID16_13325, partial [Candidatus Marinimicrobia bacterium]|nr:hypothetical protein [Candidatus Neomarinimicrobiota bacterium]
FEGYKIYRSTDPALLEPKIITDAYGIKTYRKAIFQCDLINFDQDTLWWVKGTHPADVNGVLFDMGDDTGLVHTWTDSTVQNGQTYYYAVVSYDRGLPPITIGEEGLPPTESSAIININDQGFVIGTDINAVMVTPNAPAAGYQPPQLTEIDHIEGPGTGSISIEIIDPAYVKESHTYQLRFYHEGPFQTTSYSVFDMNEKPPVTLIANSPYVFIDSILIDPLLNRYKHIPPEGDLFDGMRILVENDLIALDTVKSGWTEASQSNFIPRITLTTQSILYPVEYEIHFFSNWADTSSNNKPAKFRVWNVTEEKWSKFFFKEFNDNGIPDKDPQEYIFMWETVDGIEVKTWRLLFSPPEPIMDTTWINADSMIIDTIPVAPILPVDGDIFLINTYKPFRGEYGDSLSPLMGDIYEFTTQAATIDKQQAKSGLDQIAVVPNPYVVSATWEPKSLFSTGRGARMVEFIHLPRECTIRIYTVRGYLVDTIHHNKNMDDGSEFWDLRTKDGMDIAYGLYIFHIEAPGIGETIGKFAVVK